VTRLESIDQAETFCWMGAIMPASRDFLERMLAHEARGCDRHSATKSAKKSSDLLDRRGADGRRQSCNIMNYDPDFGLRSRARVSLLSFTCLFTPPSAPKHVR
jgi:hypothetical protein